MRGNKKKIQKVIYTRREQGNGMTSLLFSLENNQNKLW